MQQTIVEPTAPIIDETTSEEPRTPVTRGLHVKTGIKAGGGETDSEQAGNEPEDEVHGRACLPMGQFFWRAASSSGARRS